MIYDRYFLTLGYLIHDALGIELRSILPIVRKLPIQLQ